MQPSQEPQGEAFGAGVGSSSRSAKIPIPDHVNALSLDSDMTYFALQIFFFDKPT